MARSLLLIDHTQNLPSQGWSRMPRQQHIGRQGVIGLDQPAKPGNPGSPGECSIVHDAMRRRNPS